MALRLPLVVCVEMLDIALLEAGMITVTKLVAFTTAVAVTVTMTGSNGGAVVALLSVTWGELTEDSAVVEVGTSMETLFCEAMEGSLELEKLAVAMTLEECDTGVAVVAPEVGAVAIVLELTDPLPLLEPETVELGVTAWQLPCG